MKIKEFPLVTKYLFTSPLYIDDYMNVTLQTKEFDAFILLLEKHGITRSMVSETKISNTNAVTNGDHEVTVAIDVANDFKTEAFEYDLLTLLMENKSC